MLRSRRAARAPPAPPRPPPARRAGPRRCQWEKTPRKCSIMYLVPSPHAPPRCQLQFPRLRHYAHQTAVIGRHRNLPWKGEQGAAAAGAVGPRGDLGSCGATPSVAGKGRGWPAWERARRASRHGWRGAGVTRDSRKHTRGQEQPGCRVATVTAAARVPLPPPCSLRSWSSPLPPPVPIAQPDARGGDDFYRDHVVY